jgi:hypothetical protein
MKQSKASHVPKSGVDEALNELKVNVGGQDFPFVISRPQPTNIELPQPILPPVSVRVFDLILPAYE